jgi:ferredoxin-NADP reductase
VTDLALRRLTWQVATVVELRTESNVARTLVLEVADWPGHRAGQHVDVRLTAEDGYRAQRSYSIASGPNGGAVPSTVELTVQSVADGEVSSYLVGVAEVGDQFELRGPVGGYFTWDPEDPSPVLLVGGGSGVVPLMSMIRARAEAGMRVPFRLIYSIRDPDSALYTEELLRRVRDDHGLDVAWVYTRAAPVGWTQPIGRLDAMMLGEAGWPADFAPSCYVCGPTGFVEAVADMLVSAGHAPGRIKTERFGPSGG